MPEGQAGPSGEPDGGRLPIKQLTLLVKDLHAPRPVIFWLDLCCCIVAIQVGLYLSGPWPGALADDPLLAIAGFLLAMLALYRASYFNHEVSHHGRRLPGFESAWNLTVGIPLLIPSFLYSDHRNHHSDRAFATAGDGEYMPPEMRNARGAAALLVLAFVFPIMYGARFAVLAPAAWLSPAARRWVDQRASSIGLLGLVRRAPPTASERPAWRLQEALCFLYVAAAAVLVLTGIIPLQFAIRFYAAVVGMLLLHGFRVMVGHRYESDGAGNHDRIDQVYDSFNFTRSRPVTWLLLPLGFHLHALHHLFPNIPYHNLPEAHRRIATALPRHSIYHSAESQSYFAEIAHFVFRGRKRAANA